MTSPGFWTDARIAELKRLSKLYSASDCAKIMGARSRNSIVGKLRRLGLTAHGTPKPFGETRMMRMERLKAHPPVAHKPAVCADEPEARGPVGDFPERDECRWIYGDPAGRNWRCCGSEVVSGMVYCSFHMRRAFSPRPRKAGEAA